MKKRFIPFLSITLLLCGLLFLSNGCSKTVYTTQQGQTWTEYKSAKNNNGEIVNKTKKPKTKNKKKQNW